RQMKAVMMPWKCRLVTQQRPGPTRFDLGPFCFFLLALITLCHSGCRRVDQGQAAVSAVSDRTAESSTAETSTDDTLSGEVVTAEDDSAVSQSEVSPLGDSNGSPTTTASPVADANTTNNGVENAVAAASGGAASGDAA